MPIDSTLQDTDSVISTRIARHKLGYKLHSALSDSRNTLIDAPTSLGKTYEVATTAWRDHPEKTGNQPVIHLHGTKTARDDAAAESRKNDVDCRVLRSGLDTCPTAQGEFDSELSTLDRMEASEWLTNAVEVRGYTFYEAHQAIADQLDGLPCTNGDESCAGLSDLPDQDAEDDELPGCDVIHATHSFAHVEPLVEQANVVFDERPSFTESVSIQRQSLIGAINEILAEAEGSMAWSNLVEAVRTQETARLEQYQSFIGGEEAGSTYRQYDHRDARDVAMATANAELWEGGTRYIGRANGLAVVFDEQGELQSIHNPPNLSDARCVVGLDAYPSVNMWRLNTVEELTPCQVLSESQRQAWRREHRGLRVTQIGDATRSYTEGWRGDVAEPKAKRIIDELRSHYGAKFRTAISSQEIHNDVEQMLSDSGADNPELMYFGDLKSDNAFEGESVGLVVGCIDPGDETVLDLLALRGLSAMPEYDDKGERAYGRGFVGEDSDAAAELIAAVREDNLAQAVGRYARRPESSCSEAEVYVWSDALPASLVDDTVPGIVNMPTEKRADVERYLRANGTVISRDVFESLNVGKTTANNYLQELVEQGVASISKGTGCNGAHEYTYQEGSFRRSIDLGF